MPRTARIVIPGVPLHITQRGNNRSAVFLSRADCTYYLDLLRRASTLGGCGVHAYMLMGNHVHLLVSPHDASGIATMMRSLGCSYVRYFNAQYGRTGTLWEGRYKSTPIDSSRYFFTCSRYIELNPVRAGMVDHPAEFPWSSYHRNALGRGDRIVTSHPLYAALGTTDEQRHAAYTALFTTYVDPAVVDAIRHATARNAVLGGRRMREALEASPAGTMVPMMEGDAWRRERFWWA
jgi:putative transposase